MAKQSHSNSLKAEAARALWTVLFASALGIVINVYSQHPLAIFAAPDAAPVKMSIDEFVKAFKRDEAIVLLDVRGKGEYDAEHSPVALHVPLDALMAEHARIAPNLEGASTIVTMCESEECAKADEAAGMLTKLGYKNVRVLTGGWEAYRHTDLPRVGGPL